MSQEALPPEKPTVSGLICAGVDDPCLTYLLVDEGQNLYAAKAQAGEFFNTMKSLGATSADCKSSDQQPKLRVIFATTCGSQPSWEPIGDKFDNDKLKEQDPD